MAQLMNNSITFDISAKGDITGRDFNGNFTAKTKLSMVERIEEDKIRRSILGERPQDASAEAYAIASAVAYLKVHLTQFPDWWKDSAGGLALEDDNIISEVNNKCRALITAEYDKLADAAKKAQPELKAAAAQE